MATKQPTRMAPKEAFTSIIAGMLTLVWGKRTNGQDNREGHQGRIYVIWAGDDSVDRTWDPGPVRSISSRGASTMLVPSLDLDLDLYAQSDCLITIHESYLASSGA